MFKLGRKQLLGLLTAATVVVTTVGTFAVWDQLSDTATSAETTLSAVSVTATDSYVLTESRSYDASGTSVPTYTSGDITFNVSGADSLDQNMKLTPVVKVANTTGATGTVSDQFDVVITEKAGGNGGLTNGTDSKLADTNTYVATITPKDTAVGADFDKKYMTLEVTGTLEAKPTP